MKQFLNNSEVSHFDLDGYHLHSRSERTLLNLFPEDIKENDFDEIAEHVDKLVQGKSISMPIYNHVLGKRDRYKELFPKKILIIEGLHSIFLNKLLKRKKIDISIFLDTDKDIQRAWKTKRDVAERGYSFDRAIFEITNRYTFEKEFVDCQIEYADLIVQTKRSSNENVREVLISNTFLSKVKNTSFDKYFYVIPEKDLKKDFFLLRNRKIIMDKHNLLCSKTAIHDNTTNSSFQTSIITLVNLTVFFYNNHYYGHE